MQFASWINDINFSGTMSLINEIGFGESIINYLKEKGAEKNICNLDKVQKHFENLK
ncbi:MAG: hypothetical protein N4A38_02245 [Candidatus Gracilibacteria bacterium]|nr:hypothetical protein [Candidatus Gracilibacteria bacterium]